MTGYGFERRNEGLYRLICGLGLATSILMLGLVLAGLRPEWMGPGPLPAIAFGLAALVCLIAVRLMPAAGHFRCATAGASILAVALAYLGSGGQQRLAWIMVAAGTGLILIPLILGHESDRQTPKKTLRIPWPWR